MIPRQQLPVASPIAVGTLCRALAGLVVPSGDPYRDLSNALRDRYSADDVVLTDSGTSALVLALRLLAGRGGVVALPAYGCIDLTAAAIFAEVRVRLYDVDPATLSPDLDSLRGVLAAGVDAVVVAPLYGYPIDFAAVSALTQEFGATLLEDAAQAAGATFDGRSIGSFGIVSVLSFGRGKGTSGGAGGALLNRSPALSAEVRRADLALGSPSAGASNLIKVFAQYMLGRPAVYGLPARIPSLRLGEMVYHPAHEPRRLSRTAASMIPAALGLSASALSGRRATADALLRLARSSELVPIRPVEGGHAGYLRLPVRDPRRMYGEAPELGVLRSYPMTLAEHPQLRAALLPGIRPLPGASELARTLMTLPTHHFVSAADVAKLATWMTGAARTSAHEEFAPAP